METQTKKTIILTGETLTCEELVKIGYTKDVVVELDEEARERIKAGRKIIDDLVGSGRVVYGVNTGFGNFATVVIGPDQVCELQRNLIRSHAAGIGSPLTPQRARMLLALRINILAKGHSGIRLDTVNRMLAALNKSCVSYVPEKGTVGASGDLAPLAHMALGLMGEGKMWNPSTREWANASDVLASHGLEPIELQAKEGLALINGTQLISSLGSEALRRSEMIALQADVVAALTSEVLRGTYKCFDARIHAARPHSGQQAVAARMRALLLEPYVESDSSESESEDTKSAMTTSSTGKRVAVDAPVTEDGERPMKRPRGSCENLCDLNTCNTVHQGHSMPAESPLDDPRSIVVTSTHNPHVTSHEHSADDSHADHHHKCSHSHNEHSHHPKSPGTIRYERMPSEIYGSHKNCGRVQDAYTLRCIPQVHGIAHDTLSFVKGIIETELNSATDNPMVFASDKVAGETPAAHERVLSGGNFHGEYPAKAMDYLAIGVHEIANISERRIERMMNPATSDLPAFLVSKGGLNSGFMIAHVTAAALVSENKVFCHPASCDTIPTSAGKEDHVSMGGFAARKALTVVENVETVVAIELLAACQALEFLRPLTSTKALEAVYALVRTKVPSYTSDRFMSPDIEVAAQLLRDGEVWKVVEPLIKDHFGPNPRVGASSFTS